MITKVGKWMKWNNYSLVPRRRAGQQRMGSAAGAGKDIPCRCVKGCLGAFIMSFIIKRQA